MLQEVQKQWNRYQTPDIIVGVWVSERKMNDYTQIRNKKTNMVTFVSNTIGFDKSDGEVFATSWTYTSSDGIYYKIIWWDIYMPLTWAYQVEYIPDTFYSQKNYKYTLSIYVDWKLAFSDDQYPWDHITRVFSLNIGKKNKITASFKSQDTNRFNLPITLRFIKL